MLVKNLESRRPVKGKHSEQMHPVVWWRHVPAGVIHSPSLNLTL